MQPWSNSQPTYEMDGANTGKSGEDLYDPWMSVLPGAGETSILPPFGKGRKLKTSFSIGPLWRKIALFAGVVCAVVLVFGGFIAAFVGARGATHTISPSPTREASVMQGMPTQAPPSPSASPPQPTPAPTTAPLAGNGAMTTPHPQQETITDLFQRGDTVGSWGTSPDGQAWHIVSLRQAFSVVGGMAQISPADAQANPTAYTATFGDPVARPVDLSLSFVFTGFAQGQTNMGAIARWDAAGEFYKAYIDGMNLIIMKSVGGRLATLMNVPFPAMDGVLYTLRFRVVGSQLMAKVWESQAGQEPKRWMLSARDGALSRGSIGVRGLLQAGDLVQVSVFTAVVG